MNASGWAQLCLFLGLLAVTARPLGLFLYAVLDASGRTFLDPVLKPVERLLYKLLRVDPTREQNWKQYGVAMLIFSLVSMLFTYSILRTQGLLPMNSQGFGAMSEHLAFNTAASFTTNTNWQSYGGESTVSYFSQMVGLVFHNFMSAAIGIAIAAVVVRGIARDKAGTVGNFWADLVRVNLYLLLPMCLVYAIFLVSQGVVQNFNKYEVATTLEQPAAPSTAPSTQPTIQPVPAPAAADALTTAPTAAATTPPTTQSVVVAAAAPTTAPAALTQTIPGGPVASQVAIKMLGTNGGGFFNANAAHPFENSTPLSNFVQIFSIFAIPSALTYYLGRSVKNQGHGWAVWSTMAILFVVGLLVCWHYEAAGNPRMHDLGIATGDGNMEGKEVRFGVFGSALFATVTTDASCGAVNSMHDSFTPMGGLVPLINIQLGEVVFGGVGAGLYGMLVFVVIAIFIAGLMVGRTPEYLGKKIEAFDVKAASLAILVLALVILGFTAFASVTPWGGLPGNAALANNGPHGFSEMFYAYTSAVGNNGSAFAGLTANEPHWDVTLAIAMLAGRFLMIVPILALAGNLAKKKLVPVSAGSFPVANATFVLLLIGTIILVGALTFVPGLCLGPVVEHFVMHSPSHSLY